MLSTVWSIIGALLVLTVFVLVHELGHFAVGKLLGFRIDEFAIGMGPTLFSKEKGGTKFAVRALPIGGMCVFHGEDDAAADPSCFNAQPVWKRMLTVVAGPVMNILLAVVVAAITLMAYGDYMPSINEFSKENSPAYEAGILPGDVIVRVDDTDINYYTECFDAIAAADSNAADITVLRDGKKLTFTVQNIFDEEEEANKIGVMISPVRVQYGFFAAIENSVRYVRYIVVEMLKALGSLFTTGIQSGDVAGPVGTISLIGQAVRAGFEVVLRLGVLLSINLGIINLLPLPALDGGRLVFMVVEAVRGKPVPPEKEGMVHFVGIVLLLALMALLTVMDIRNLFM